METDGKEVVLRERTQTGICIFSPTFLSLITALNKSLHILSRVFQCSAQLWLLYHHSTAESQILTHPQNAAKHQNVGLGFPPPLLWINPSTHYHFIYCNLQAGLTMDLVLERKQSLLMMKLNPLLSLNKSQGWMKNYSPLQSHVLLPFTTD